MSDNKASFQNYLFLNNILCRVPKKNGDEILTNLLELLKRHHSALDIEKATEEVKKREQVFSTVIAPGFALPHARIVGLEKPLMAVACSPDGFEFGADKSKINVMILLLTPIEEPNLHLQMMSLLAKVFSDPVAVSKIANMEAAPDVLEFFTGNRSDMKMAEYLLARDVMKTGVTPLHETDTLREAINTFAMTRRYALPVIDSANDLRGIVSLKDILRYCLPEHILWLDNLSPIYRFQPFVDLLKSSEDTKISDLMKELDNPVSEDVPAIQLAKLFLNGDQEELVIVDKDGHLSGMVSLREFCATFFWE